MPSLVMCNLAVKHNQDTVKNPELPYYRIKDYVTTITQSPGKDKITESSFKQ
ncbi:hypothetical protein BCR33DRAFT_728290 [Rhizoclosmatium globosum]|uniref:Uncharacterized protein n=1 Tax=Rhizoclosmatium globosum TaxID=329046 RepID=A0A1Y2AKQ0_9FUNG|nr:hypothetical protein BCR33DRAFT_728290 [Rhizoclosmatium globosum]|eukprot:ORY23086.1 hypothetical protein BCR33DRAFT_728290 [Rhizoclosmatium globosum]